MTETEWLTAKRRSQLLRYIHETTATSDRKFRLFAVACCRRVAEQIPDSTLTEVIEACERLAEGLDAEDWNQTQINKLIDLRTIVERSPTALRSDGAEYDIDLTEFVFAVSQLTNFPIYPDDCADSCMSALCGHDDYFAGHGEVLFQIDLLRDIIGNPFRPITLNPSRLTSTVLALASGIYHEKAFDRMPILADALQDAGCDNEEILNHCRQDGEHVRGCFVVDLMLNKSRLNR
jgi:hypothetical protein